MPNVVLTVEELAEAEGLDFGVGPWFPIDQKRIRLFADATEDRQWIHVDEERAAEGPFGTAIAHGYLTLALVPRLLRDLLEVTDQLRGMNYGIDRLRFTGTVPSGSRVRMKATLNRSTRRADRGVQYGVHFEVEVEGHDRPAAVGEVLYLTYASDAEN